VGYFQVVDIIESKESVVNTRSTEEKRRIQVKSEDSQILAGADSKNISRQSGSTSQDQLLMPLVSPISDTQTGPMTINPKFGLNQVSQLFTGD
jgi:hypothetical protein